MTDRVGTSPRGMGARLDRCLEAALRWTTVVCLAGLAVLVTALVLVRFFPIVHLDWSDEIVELAFAWMVFLGTAALWRTREHITIDFIPQALAGTRWGQVLDVVVSVMALAFLVIFTWQGWQFTIQAQDTSPMLALPRAWWYVVLPLSGVVMIGYTLCRLAKTALPVGAKRARPEG